MAHDVILLQAKGYEGRTSAGTTSVPLRHSDLVRTPI
jgi:hypothetical protein